MREKHVGDETHLRNPRPGRHIGEIGHLQAVRGGRSGSCGRPGPVPSPARRSGRVVNTFLPPGTAPNSPSWRMNRPTRSRPTSTPARRIALPRLAGPVHREILVPDRPDLPGQHHIGQTSIRRRPGLVRVVVRRGPPATPCKWARPRKLRAVSVDELDSQRHGRSSSASLLCQAARRQRTVRGSRAVSSARRVRKTTSESRRRSSRRCFPAGFAGGGAPFDVGAAEGRVAGLGDGDAVQGGVDLAVPAARQPEALVVPGPHRDRGGPVPAGEGRLGAEPAGAGGPHDDLGGGERPASGIAKSDGANSVTSGFI